MAVLLGYKLQNKRDRHHRRRHGEMSERAEEKGGGEEGIISRARPNKIKWEIVRSLLGAIHDLFRDFFCHRDRVHTNNLLS